VGSPASGPVVCVSGTRLVNVRQSHKEVAQVDYSVQYVQILFELVSVL
jgi:hypothetical protein